MRGKKRKWRRWAGPGVERKKQKKWAGPRNGVGEKEMYDMALKVNSYWFPQTYIDLATYFKEQGQEWDEVDPQLALSANYSSAQGYQTTREKIVSLPKPQQGGGGCGV